ncbi:MAG: hypothetical protein PHE55_16890, partial [Methylococcaceae bacterium]|nr:hypothetical protein [Methylococcaceae bacterium]
MKIYFLEGGRFSGGLGEIPVTPVDVPQTWRRPLAVVAASILAAALHGLVWVWYLNRPQPAPLVEATPLPMIDIALSAPPASPLPAAAPPPPQPVQPEKKPDPAPV